MSAESELRAARSFKAAQRFYGNQKLVPEPEPPRRPLQLPDEQKVLIVERDGYFFGQATFWKRNGSWEVIGATRRISKTVMQSSVDTIVGELTDRKLSYRWQSKRISFAEPISLVIADHAATPPGEPGGRPSGRVVLDREAFPGSADLGRLPIEAPSALALKRPECGNRIEHPRRKHPEQNKRL